jgi:SAM-dependent methyltransferase
MSDADTDRTELAPSCHLCGSLGWGIVDFDHSVTSEAKLVAHRSALWLCEHCGHLFTTLEVDLRTYYATQYDATLTDDGLDELVTTESGEMTFRTDVDYGLFRRILGDELHAGTSVFEYGCGHGRILSRLKKDGVSDLTAFDVSETYRAPVEAMIGEGRLTIGAPPMVRDVDVACSFFVLEHDELPVEALLYLHTVLKPGGLLYLVVPNYLTNVTDLACADHVNHFSPRSLHRLLESCGFEIMLSDDTSSIGAVAVLARAVPPPVQILVDTAEILGEARGAGREIVDHLARLKRVVERLDRSHGVYLYGVGFNGALMSAYLKAARGEIAGVFDANPRKHGTLRLGHLVAAPEAATKVEHGDSTLVICVNPRVSRQLAARFAPVFGSVQVA